MSFFSNIFAKRCEFCDHKPARRFIVRQFAAYPEDDPDNGLPENLLFPMAEEHTMCYSCKIDFDVRLYDVIPV